VLAGLFVASRRIVRENRLVPHAATLPAKPAITYHWALQRAMSGKRAS
jgi:hypothetical protein